MDRLGWFWSWVRARERVWGVAKARLGPKGWLGNLARYESCFDGMKTILLLFASNVFMTCAWYGHLKWKFLEGRSLLTVIAVSWVIAFFEYCLMVPANRIGYAQGFTGYQLKVIQEAITLTVFIGFAWLVLKERLTWNYAVSFALIFLAVWFAVAFKPAAGAAAGH